MRALAAFLLLLLPAHAGKEKETLRWAPTWEAAVEEARARNVPIVIHRHGFYWPPCWALHRSVLENPAYIRFSRESCVELMCMKDIEQALAEKPDRAKTYKTTDPYGDEIECFECCPGVTIDQMKQLHEGKALEYMKGPLMPYTAIVDPHTLKDLGGIERGGATTADAFIAEITRHAKSLEEQHGKGCDGRLWEYVADAQVRIDLLLGEEKVEKALALLAEMEKKAARENDAVKRKVGASRDVVHSGAAARLDALEKEIAGGQGGQARAEAARLAKLLDGTPLGERAKAIGKA